MTPTEQDKELREKIIKAIVSDPAIRIEGHHSDGTPIDEESAADAIMQFITADRKRVELGARLDELRKMSDLPYIGLRAKRLERLGDRAAELKQELEKL